MHLLVPFAGAHAEPALGVLRSLRLPVLSRLLGRLAPTAHAGSDEHSLTPPHERALADAIGLHGDDGALPWGAFLAQADGIDTGTAAWALLSPTHWHVGRDHVSMADPDTLALDADASRALFEAVAPLFREEGWRTAWGAPTRWYASHESLVNLPCASPDRVIGRGIDRWLAPQAAARVVRRLQAEAQMLLYTHAANDAREAQGLWSINSFWASGCGVGQVPARPAPDVHAGLRTPALAGDGPAWAEAWHALDAGPLAALLAAAERGEPTSLVLCGERRAVRLEARPRPFWHRLLRPPRRDPLPLLESL